MTRKLALLPWLLAVPLAVVLWLELAGGKTRPAPALSARQAAAVAVVAPPPAAPVADWVRAILARPLLRADRRPPFVPLGPGAGGPAGPPRLSGVLISSTDRFAIFAASDGKLTVARQGAQLGAYMVMAIGEGQVTLLGPGGRRVLHPQFAADLPSGPPGAKTSAAPPGGPRPQLPPAPPGSGNILSLLTAGHKPQIPVPPPPTLDSLLLKPPAK